MENLLNLCRSHSGDTDFLLPTINSINLNASEDEPKSTKESEVIFKITNNNSTLYILATEATEGEKGTKAKQSPTHRYEGTEASQTVLL